MGGRETENRARDIAVKVKESAVTASRYRRTQKPREPLSPQTRLNLATSYLNVHWTSYSIPDAILPPDRAENKTQFVLPGSEHRGFNDTVRVTGIGDQVFAVFAYYLFNHCCTLSRLLGL